MKFLLVLFIAAELSIVTSSSDLRQDEISSRGKRSTEGYPKDCKDVYDRGQSSDGVYLIEPEGSEPFEVYCNNSIDGGGWTVIQRRLDGSVDFYRDWSSYKDGFGFRLGEFWLGNDNIAYLTNQNTYELRIDMKSVNNQSYFAKFNLFRISDETSDYTLVHLGDLISTSTAGNGSFHNSVNQAFSTKDRDNDRNRTVKCARYNCGAWWFNSCREYSHLNGLYTTSRSTYYKGILWHNLPGDHGDHLKYAEMKIRPRQDS